MLNYLKLWWIDLKKETKRFRLLFFILLEQCLEAHSLALDNSLALMKIFLSINKEVQLRPYMIKLINLLLPFSKLPQQRIKASK